MTAKAERPDLDLLCFYVYELYASQMKVAHAGLGQTSGKGEYKKKRINMCMQSATVKHYGTAAPLAWCLVGYLGLARE